MPANLNLSYGQDFRPFTESILSGAEKFRVTFVWGRASGLRYCPQLRNSYIDSGISNSWVRRLLLPTLPSNAGAS